MARYYIAFESMKRFLGLRGNETLGELVKREREREENMHLFLFRLRNCQSARSFKTLD